MAHKLFFLKGNLLDFLEEKDGITILQTAGVFYMLRLLHDKTQIKRSHSIMKSTLVHG